MESFIMLPLITMSGMPVGNNVGPVSQATLGILNTSPIVSFSKQNIEASVFWNINHSEDREAFEALQEARQVKADAIDAYFSERSMPLEGTGMIMVLEAERNDIDWRLLPAIAVRESTGGKHACIKADYNSFGWGSCKISFDSNKEAIQTVAHNLGGNNPNTDHHYAGKTTKQILQKYNPPSVVPRYAMQVMKIMDIIGGEEMTINTTEKVNTTT